MSHISKVALAIAAGALITHIFAADWLRLVVTGILVAVGAYLWQHYLRRIPEP